MPSKKYKGKTCAYCGKVGVSDTGDHVFAREFFLARHRANLPQVPACKRCNNEKSTLETYLLQILPLGANHPDALETSSTLMPKRAAHVSNKILRSILEHPNKPVSLIDQSGQQHERIPVHLDAGKLTDWCGMVARGLANFHWGITTPKYEIKTIPLALSVESEILAMVGSFSGGERVQETLGNGAFAYRGFKCADGEPASMWMIYLYGAMPIGGDPGISNACASSWGVFITPKEI